MKQEVIQKAPEQVKKPTPNMTGIPTQMKLDFERRSGLSFDDVRVHYNSDKPAKVGALAYTQGTQVHVGPGQEKHLRHELGHVVQQKQGIVRPTTWINGLPVNDSPVLEHNPDTSFASSYVSKHYSQQICGIMPIQCAINVGLQILPSSTISKNYKKESLQITSIRLADRSATGLTNPETGHGTQGDHTVADVLFKSYQCDLIQNQNLDYAVFIYHNLLTNLNGVADFLLNILSAAKTKEQTNGNQPTPKPSRKGTKATGKKRPRVDAQSQIDTDINRTGTAKKKINEGLQTVKIVNSQEASKISVWTQNMCSIITHYNDAYAHLPVATTGTGSGGKNEADYISRLRDWKESLKNNYNPDRAAISQYMAAIEGLIDMDAVNSLDFEKLTSQSVSDYVSFKKKCVAIRQYLKLQEKQTDASSGPALRAPQMASNGVVAMIQEISQGSATDLSIPLLFYIEIVYSFLKHNGVTGSTASPAAAAGGVVGSTASPAAVASGVAVPAASPAAVASGVAVPAASPAATAGGVAGPATSPATAAVGVTVPAASPVTTSSNTIIHTPVFPSLEELENLFAWHRAM